MAESDLDRARQEIAENPLEYAPELIKIVPKERSRGLIPLVPKPGQIALEEKLAEQKAAGKPLRVIIDKSRQVGMSTWIQARQILATTQLHHVNALTVAHEDDAVQKLYRMGNRMYENLPKSIRPERRAFKTNSFIHFGQKGENVLAPFPDSVYELNTAGAPESGRAGTFHRVHLSEYAFYPQAEDKLTAVMQAVGDHPDTFVGIESTPNGHNHFKELWDAAVDGQNEFIPFFWAWWQEPDYMRAFVNEAERADFRVGDTDQSLWAEEEKDLTEPGPLNILTGEHVPLTLEQLNWRRWAIGNKVGGKLDKFHQEYPAYPEQGFLATGKKVFEPLLVSRAMKQALQTDPVYGEGGPIRGTLIAQERPLQAGRHGKLQVPRDPKFVPARLLNPGEESDWRFWLDYEEGALVIPEDGRYVLGVDVSEGLPESEDENGDPAFQAIQIIDHRTKIQVAEYRSRVDEDLLAEHAVLAALLFNDAILAIEKTGPGLAVVKKVWHDFHYTRTYYRKQQEHKGESRTDRLGWSTDRATKPLLIAGGSELLREETHGLKSRRTVSEMQTYVRLSTGKTVPERGKFADLLMAWLIAQQVAHEEPVPRIKRDRDRQRQAAPNLPRYGVFG